MFKNKIKVFTLTLSIFLISIAPVFAQSTQSQTASNNRLQQILNFLMADRVKEAADLMNFTTSSIFITVGGLIISIALLFMSSSIGESLGAAPTSGGGKTGFMLGAAAGGAILKGGSKLSGATSDWFKSRKNNTGTSTTAGGKGSVGGQSSKGAGAPNQYKSNSNTGAGGNNQGGSGGTDTATANTGNFSVNPQASSDSNFSVTNAQISGLSSQNKSNIGSTPGTNKNSSSPATTEAQKTSPASADNAMNSASTNTGDSNKTEGQNTSNTSSTIQSSPVSSMPKPSSMSAPKGIDAPTSMAAPSGMAAPAGMAAPSSPRSSEEISSKIKETAQKETGEITGK